MISGGVLGLFFSAFRTGLIGFSKFRNMNPSVHVINIDILRRSIFAAIFRALTRRATVSRDENTSGWFIGLNGSTQIGLLAVLFIKCFTASTTGSEEQRNTRCQRRNM